MDHGLLTKLFYSSLTKATNVFLRLKKYCLFLIALFISKILIYNGKQPVWVIGGHGGRAYCDNNVVLHKHLLKALPRVSIYWIIKKSSPDAAKVKIVGPVLYKGSFRSYLYNLIAQVSICSHSLRDLLDIDTRRALFFLKGSKKVFVGHGIYGLKRCHGNAQFDIYLVSSEFEKKINAWKIEEEKIYITGYPRYDVLFEYIGKVRVLEKTESHILYMPTWRDWLVDKSNTVEWDEYKAKIDAFLNDQELIDFIEKKNIFVDINLHINMQKYYSEHKIFYSNNIRLIGPEEDLQTHILKSRLLITDYSSVCFDFLYLNKPVLFYQFDVYKYLIERGSYFDLSKELFGPIAYDPDQAVKELKKIISSNYDVSDFTENMNIMRERMFKYVDNKNCERILKTIVRKSK